MSGPTPCWSTKQICIKIHVPSLSCPSTGIFNNYSTRARWISSVIIQQIVTMPIYGKEALNICHPYMTDILRYT